MLLKRPWPWLLLLALGCGESTLPATQVVVLVGGDAKVDELYVTVQTENGRNVSEDRRIRLVPRDGRLLPTSFTLLPGDAERPAAYRFRLQLLGLLNGQSTPVVRVIVVAGFEAGRTSLLPVVLSAACAGDTCDCPFDQDNCQRSCEPAGISRLAGCAPVASYARLASIEPGQELPTLASGAGGCEAGEVLDASGLCADLDECAFGFDDCDTDPPACHNEVGGALGFSCSCPTGYRGDGVGTLGCR